MAAAANRPVANRVAATTTTAVSPLVVARATAASPPAVASRVAVARTVAPELWLCEQQLRADLWLREQLRADLRLPAELLPIVLLRPEVLQEGSVRRPERPVRLQEEVLRPELLPVVLRLPADLRLRGQLLPADLRLREQQLRPELRLPAELWLCEQLLPVVLRLPAQLLLVFVLCSQVLQEALRSAGHAVRLQEVLQAELLLELLPAGLLHLRWRPCRSRPQRQRSGSPGADDRSFGLGYPRLPRSNGQQRHSSLIAV